MSKLSTKLIVLAGRPNTGKTTLFNALTGLRQKVANFSGCTVEKAAGELIINGQSYEIVDLPGTHCLRAESEDEKVAFRYLAQCANEQPDNLILCLAEASNLSNDLALAIGLQRAGYPVALVINMIDEARLNGIEINTNLLSQELKMPVLSCAANSGEGLNDITQLISNNEIHPSVKYPLNLCELSAAEIKMIQNEAFNQAEKLTTKAVRMPSNHELKTLTRSIRIDRILLHPILGPLLLVLVMFTLFQALFTFARPLMDIISNVLLSLSDSLRHHLSDSIISSLLCDGVIPGISAVIVFLPQIAILFSLLGLLEQSGYLPRAAAMVDRLLRPFGLDGRVFIPLLSGYACAIPGIMATRTISNEKKRLTAILMTPLMTCSARLPVYTLIITAFVPSSFRPFGLSGRGLVMAGLYAIGILVALLLSLLMKFITSNEASAFSLTILPPYRLPHFREISHYVWQRCWHFLSRAGYVIFFISLALWLLANFPRNNAPLASFVNEPLAAQQSTTVQRQILLDQAKDRRAAAQIEASLLGKMGHFIEPVFRPLGWDWRVSIAVLSSLVAREVFVGTLGTIYAMGHETNASNGLILALSQAKNEDGSARYTLATAVGLLIFFAIALQCLSTVTIVYRETGSWKWPAAQFSSFFIMAYALAFTAYRLLS